MFFNFSVLCTVLYSNKNAFLVHLNPIFIILKVLLLCLLVNGFDLIAVIKTVLLCVMLLWVPLLWVL